MATCKSCGRRITWLTTAGGNHLPVDEDPDPAGNVVVVSGSLCRVFPNAQAAQAAFPAEPRYVSHFVTCPDAARFRSQGGGSEGRTA